MSNNATRSLRIAQATNNAAHGKEIREPAGPKKWAPRRFTEPQVREIRADRRPNKTIAAQYGVHKDTITAIKTGINYGWII